MEAFCRGVGVLPKYRREIENASLEAQNYILGKFKEYNQKEQGTNEMCIRDRHIGNNAYRFVNAVSDFATHAKPLRERSNYRESLFARTVDGNAMIDRAYDLVKAA